MPDLKIWSSREINRLKRDMNRLFESLCIDYGLPGTFCQEEMEVEEDDREIRVRLAVPGLCPDDMEVKVTQYGLEISGRREVAGPEGRREERFTRHLGLPCRVLPGEVKAVHKEGTLRVVLPKCTDNQCRSIDIVKE
ncbi:Hsp20/alpha crystallin family protein [Paucidesulfovibrio longus]|uniref:Hsp20/alpha crystallin family protein n=1 Tax=Paucidesulfovibrio longus TaxID=889 RepID=UPI0003B2FBED|nr:Hsp20/alpha crystallin family protein [Paucidesulfovibrio longus]